jgi:exodeoxyribonuclease VII small subunit
MSNIPTNAPSSEQPTFEQSIKRLEEIVHALEDGKLGLNESLERYEEGVKLLRQSYELLQRAERRIELLSGLDAEGNAITQPFDDSATFDREATGKRRGRRRSNPKTSVDKGVSDQQIGESRMDEA